MPQGLSCDIFQYLLDLLPNTVGYINTDDVISIKRDISKKIISYNSIKEWAMQQLEQIKNSNLQSLYFKKYNDLLMTFDLFDENFPLIVTKKQNQYMFKPITYFRDYLKNNDEISFYQEGYNDSSRQPDCPGFIKCDWGLNLFEIVVDEDVEKLLSSDRVIRNILKQEWGDFEVELDNLLQKNQLSFSFNTLPYFTILKFKKKK